MTQPDLTTLNNLYAGCRAYHGEMHDHSASGGTSDGQVPLDEWVKELAELNMDFAAILDHRQVRHMYLPEWKDGLFVGGSEPGTRISDSKATETSMHYNMVFLRNFRIQIYRRFRRTFRLPRFHNRTVRRTDRRGQGARRLLCPSAPEAGHGL